MTDPDAGRLTHPLSAVSGRVIILIILVAMIAPYPVLWFIWPLASSYPDVSPLADSLFIVGFYGIAVTLLCSAASGRNVNWQDLPLSMPARREAIRDGLLALPLLGIAIVCVYLFYFPLSYIWPDLVQSYLLDQPPLIIARWDAWSILATTLNALSLVVLAPVVEEIFFRGFLLNRWMSKYGTVLGVAFSSLVFGLLHADILGAIVFGVFLAMIYLRSGSLAGPILIHAVNNFLVMLLEGWEVSVYGEVQRIMVAAFQADWWMAVLAALVSIPWLVWYWGEHIIAPLTASQDNR